MGQCRFITCSLFTTLVGDVANRGRWAYVRGGITRETSIPSAQSCYEPKVQSLSHVQPFVAPWTGACQASLPITDSRSLLIPMSIESVKPFSGSKKIKSNKVCLPGVCNNLRKALFIKLNENVLQDKKFICIIHIFAWMDRDIGIPLKYTWRSS